MRTDTKNKYMERLAGLGRQLQVWFADEVGDEDEMQKLWQRIRSVENGLIDGVELNTILVSNKITALEVAIAGMRERILGTGEVDGESIEPIPIVEVPEPTELGTYVMERLGSIQGELADLYGMIVSKHPLAALGMAPVDELKIRSAEIGSTMRNIAKLTGVL